jgi:hypothetical protein
MAQMVAIGVDTHKDRHVAVALEVLGGELDHCLIAATRVGYEQLLDWSRRLGEPVFAIEGTGSCEPYWVSRRLGFVVLGGSGGQSRRVSVRVSASYSAGGMSRSASCRRSWLYQPM